jgi:hypothetical protein
LSVFLSSLLLLFQLFVQLFFQFTQLFVQLLFQVFQLSLFQSKKGSFSKLSKKSLVFSSQLYSNSSQKIILSISCKSTIKSNGEFSVVPSVYNQIFDIS